MSELGDPQPGSKFFQTLGKDEQKRILLEKYGEKDPNAFTQLDGFVVGRDSVDSVMCPDDEGDCLFGSTTTELMHGADVRIFIKKGTSPNDAIRLIGKLGDWLSLAPGIAAPGLETLLDGIPVLDEFEVGGSL